MRKVFDLLSNQDFELLKSSPGLEGLVNLGRGEEEMMKEIKEKAKMIEEEIKKKMEEVEHFYQFKSNEKIEETTKTKE